MRQSLMPALCAWVVFGLAGASSIRATVVFSQPHGGSGTVIKSAWYAPDGMDGDQYVWDSFTLGSTQSFNQVNWRGGYTNLFSGAGKAPVYDFTIDICPTNSNPVVNEPDIIAAPLAHFIVGGNAGETPAGSFPGTVYINGAPTQQSVPLYDYSYVLPQSFTATAGTKYWIKIYASQGVTPQYYWPPDWGLAIGNPAAAGSDGSHFYEIVGGTLGGGNLYASGAPDVNFSLLNVAPVVNAVWGVNSNGNWSEGGNWNNGVAPNGTDHSASFGTIITAARTVTVDLARTVGTINFAGSNSYTINGASTLTMDSATQAGINVTAGNHTISAPLTLNQNTTITVSPWNSLLALTGTLNAAGRTITTGGMGTVQFENVRAAALNVSGGYVRISPKASANAAGGTTVVDSLTIATGSQLDLANNSMIINYTAPGTLLNDTRLNLQSYAINSSLEDASHKLGYGDNAVLGKTTFAGQSVGPNCVLLKFTYGGDANLDGQVDVTDLGALATNWQASAPWTGGDFNYDGFVDVTDLGILATNWQAGVGTPLGAGSLQQALAALGLGGVSVPEPASAAVLLGAALLLVSQRGVILARAQRK